ncbi:MAG TPA: tyrosine-type recombinase/integrase [Anaerolineales bacterium]|nr:tyrosine-type recombinase/integrase [Anaerolineales bacterium]
MTEPKNEQHLSQGTVVNLGQWARAFLIAKRAEGVTTSTIKRAYAPILANVERFCRAHEVTTVEAIDPTLIREYLLARAEMGRKPSDVHRHYRVIKTFLRWYEIETAAEGWRNPINRVAPPKVPELVLDPAPLEDIAAMVRESGPRDRAILLTLVDTGLRASELLGLNVEDFDFAEAVLTVRHGKGGKVRLVPLGANSRRALRRWLRIRPARGVALFLSKDGTRLTYQGLRTQILRLAKRAGVKAPQLHGIRRAFAIGMLRAGVDLLTLSRLLGHSRLDLLAKYAKQSIEDLRAAVERASVADKL